MKPTLSDKKTLYVTDLDGTLMHDDKTLSEYTVNTLNRLIEDGVLITYATARTLKSAWEITSELDFKIPVITRNGTVFADHIQKREIEISFFNRETVDEIVGILGEKLAYCGFVTCYFDGVMAKCFMDGKRSAGFEKYVVDHADDKSMKPVRTVEDMVAGTVTYFTLIADRAELQYVYEAVSKSDHWECVFQKDTYGEEYWLELCPKNATKAKAVLKLKEQLGCDRVVVFGDSTNDLSMFAVADEALAVANGIAEVKAAASSIIDSNENDGVAKYLHSIFEKY